MEIATANEEVEAMYLRAKKLEGDLDQLKNRIKLYMGDASELVSPNGATLATNKLEEVNKLEKDKFAVENPDAYRVYASFLKVFKRKRFTLK